MRYKSIPNRGIRGTGYFAFSRRQSKRNGGLIARGDDLYANGDSRMRFVENKSLTAFGRLLYSRVNTERSLIYDSR